MGRGRCAHNSETHTSCTQIRYSWFVILKRWIKIGASKRRSEVTVGDDSRHINTQIIEEMLS